MHPKECSTLIRQIHCAMQKNANNELRESDLTFSQFQVLSILMGKPDGQCTLKNLEKRMGIAQSTTVGLVKRISEKGFVECIGDASDRRVKLVQITENGRQVCRDMEQNARRSEQRLLMNLNPDECVTIIRLLEKVHTAVSEGQEDG